MHNLVLVTVIEGGKSLFDDIGGLSFCIWLILVKFLKDFVKELSTFEVVHDNEELLLISIDPLWCR